MEILFFVLIIPCFIFIIIKTWVIPARGFTQLGLFTISEISFFCNKGAACQNCPLSFGICPIGTTQRLFFIKNFPFIATLSLVAMTGLLLGSLTCGWACPVGFIQDILHAPRLKRIKIANRLKPVRYPVLAVGILLVFLELRFQLLSKNGIGIFHPKVIIIGSFLLSLAIIIKRPFCRVLCPYGLIYGNANKLSRIKVNLNKQTCKVCNSCQEACITDINPIKEVNGDLCLKCYSCKKVCPQAKMTN